MAAVRLILAVVAAGIVGTVANSVVVAALTPNEFIPLAVNSGRNAIVAAVVAIVALTVTPSLLAKLVFGIRAPWPFVLGVNAVYAVAAWTVYWAIARRGIGRRSPGTG